MADGTGGDNSSPSDTVGWSVNRLRRRPRKYTQEIERELLAVTKPATERKRLNSLPKHQGSGVSGGSKGIRNYPEFRFATGKGREPDSNSRNRWETVTDAPHYPDVNFIPLPFHENLGQLVQPTTLYNGSLETSCTFYLTPSQAALIEKGRKGADIFSASDKYSVQILVRIGLLEVTSAQHDYYPPGLIVYVNRAQIPLPVFSVSSNEPKKNLPIDITAYVQIDPFAANNIKIVSHPTFQRYVTAVYLVQKHSWNILLNRLRSKALRVAYYTKAMIQQKLKDDAENDILTTSLRVSLVCPLGKMRMGTPCRPTTCDHIQCFDASIFLQMNEKKATWQCPVCNKTAYYDTLTIDEYFQDVVTSSNLPSSCVEIEVMVDGGWRPMGSTPVNTQPSTSAEKVENSVNLDSSDGEIEVIGCEAKESPRKPARRSRTPAPDFVDLVSSPSPPASPESQSKLLPFKKRRTHQTPERRNELMTVIDLDSSSDIDDEVKACSSTASTSSSSSDSDIIQPPPSRKQRQRCINNSSDSDNSLCYPVNYFNPFQEGSILSDEDIQVSHVSQKYNLNPEGARINSISYSINKAKSSATSIVIQKATSVTVPTSQEKDKNVETLPDSSSKASNETGPSDLSMHPELYNQSNKHDMESISNFLISAARSNSCQLMGVIDQVAENLSSDRTHNVCDNFPDLNDATDLSIREMSIENNDSSVICLDSSSNVTSYNESKIHSVNQELTPMQSLMLAISQVNSETEQERQPDPVPSTSKNNKDENSSLKSVQICDAVSSTGDVEISQDHNYVNRDSAVQLDLTECQASVVTSSNDEEIQSKKLDQVGQSSSIDDNTLRIEMSNKNINNTLCSETEDLSSNPEITNSSMKTDYSVSIPLEQLESFSSSKLTPDNPPTTEVCRELSSSIDISIPSSIDNNYNVAIPVANSPASEVSPADSPCIPEQPTPEVFPIPEEFSYEISPLPEEFDVLPIPEESPPRNKRKAQSPRPNILKKKL